LLPPHVVVERVSGEAPRDFFVGPDWALDKSAIRRRLDEELGKRDTWQGKYFLGS
jgi:radical SAM superfamily enzyme